MIYRIIDMILELKGKPYVPVEDNDRLLELYQMVLENCADKETFATNSESIVDSLCIGGMLEESEEKSWLNYICNMFASFLAVQIQNKNTVVSDDKRRKITGFFLNGGIQNEISAVGLYNCAQMFSISNPMLCYKLTMHAFQVNPHLADYFDVDYCFEGATAEEHLTEECPFCGEKGDKVTPFVCIPQLNRLQGRKNYPPAKLWMRCSRCENFYTYNFPLTMVDINNGHYTQKQDGNILKIKHELNIYNSIFKQIKKLSSGNNYLEIGVGNGEMLAVALELGYQVEGIEICKEDSERVSAVLNVPVACCDIIDYEPHKQYDVIVMGDVLEHVTRPVYVLEKVRRMLKDNGVLWISTPNYNSAYARMEKFYHCMWHELNHYTYVSYESLKKLLSGMEMEIVDYKISDRYRGSMEVFVKKTM